MGRMSKDAKQKVLVSHDIESDGEYDDDVYTFTNPMAPANNEIISLDSKFFGVVKLLSYLISSL
jgi:hypothetical protein